MEPGVPSVNPTAGHQLKNEESKEIARTNIPELPQTRAQGFSCPVFVFKPKIRLAKARTLFTETFVASEIKLPEGTDIESVVNAAGFVYVPSWLISGSAFGEWRAIGIKAIDCAECNGTGTMAGKEDGKPCRACNGTGRVNQPKHDGTAMSGIAKAAVEEHVQSVFAGIQFDPDFSTAAKPVKATPATVANLYCLQPDHDYKKAKEILTELLALSLKNKALGDLAHYDAVENLHFGSTEVYLFNKVEMWLYPFYICWYEKRGKKQFAICDGITGKVALPQQKHRWNFFRSMLAVAGLGALIYLGGGLFSHPKNAEGVGPVIPHYNRATDENIFKQMFATIPAYVDPLYDEPGDKAGSDKPDNDKNDKPKIRSAKVAAAVRQLMAIESADNTRNIVASPPNGNLMSTNQGASGLDCNKTSIKAEKLICSSKELTNDDREMARIFELRKKNAFLEIFRKQIEFEQANWVENVRNACTDEACLLNAYSKKIGTLSPTRQANNTGVCPIPGHC